MATDDVLSGLLGELRAGGELDSRGRFTLDRAQARAKMQKFQLVDARRYVLELVQAAVLRGASEVVFDIDADDMRMRCDGACFSGEELGELWSSIFADGDEPLLRGQRQLALGLNAALGLGPRRITVRSGGHQLVLRPGADEQLTAIEPVAGTTIHVEQRLRLGLIVDFVRNISGRLGEELHLRERCVHAPVPVRLDGVGISAGLTVAGAIAAHEFAASGLVGVVALVPGAAPASLRLVKDGVWIDALPLEHCGPGIVAVVAGERLRKDVSLAKIVADEALKQAVREVRGARWGLMARLVAAARDGALPAAPTLARVASEVLQFLRPRELRTRPELAVVAETLRWLDVRTGTRTPRTVSLAELAAAGPTQLGYALGEHQMLAPEGPPVLRVDAVTARQLARIVGGEAVDRDIELARAATREAARRRWLKRPMAAQLPDNRRYLLRGPIAGAGLRGELGLRLRRDHAVADEGTLWLLREGCLLARLELDWEIPGLDVVLEADFTPGELYDDAVRDATLVHAALHAIAAMMVPLATLVAGSGGALLTQLRGLVRSWLTLVLDAPTRDLLWSALKVPAALRPDQAAAQAVLPSPAQLRAGGGMIDVLLQLPLFEDLDGAPRSLDELARRHAQLGRLDEIDRSVALEPTPGLEVLRLDGVDRRILAGLLGPGALRSWAPSLAVRRRERKFWAAPARTIAELAADMQAQLQAAGLDPALWSRTLRVGAVEAVIMLAHGSVPPGVEPRLAQIELRHHGRPLVTRAIDLGIWPIVGAASSTALQPAPDWDDVVDDAAMTAIVAALREGAWALVAGLLSEQREALARWRWVAAPLLRRLAEPDAAAFAARLPELSALPLLHTLDGGAISVDALDAVLRAQGRIEWVPPTTPTTNLGEPPMLRETAQVVTALRQRCGTERVVDGGPRLRQRGREAQLAGLPVVARAVLDASRVWGTSSLAGGLPEVTGEIGLARAGQTSGLTLVLCTRGRQVAVVTVADAAAPALAIVADEALPIDAQGQVDARSKRYGQLLRRCRRALPGLIVALCARFAALEPAAQAEARALLLGYAAALLRRIAQGSATTDRGLDALRGLPLFRDVWDGAHTLAALEASGSVDAVGPEARAPEPGLASDRTILRVDAAAQACLAAAMGPRLRRIDERWDEELAALRELAHAPRFVLPDLRRAAWVERRATVAGGLQAQLWLARAPAGAEALVFTRVDREVGRVALLAALPCSGVVSGQGLVIGADGVVLDARQRDSLGKQICGLYEALARQLRSGRLPGEQREGALARLVAADAALAGAHEPALARLGKPLAQLRAALEELVSPALRRERGAPGSSRATGEAARPAARATTTERPSPASRASGSGAGSEASPTAAVERTPEQRLLAALRAELEWARARHGTLLDALGLDRLAIGEARGGGIVAFERGIMVQRGHPLVARMLERLAAGGAIDPIELSFVASAAYTVMNAIAEEIDAEDERAFVTRLAESLVLGLGAG